MKKRSLLFLALLLILMGCAPSEPSSSDIVIVEVPGDLSSSYPPENPPADSSLPGESSEPPETEPSSTPEPETPAPESEPKPDSAPVSSMQVSVPESASAADEPAVPAPESLSSEAPAVQAASAPSMAVVTVPDEIRAVWLSYLEFLTLAQGQDEAQFTANIAYAFDQIRSSGFNSVWLQVRPFGDALYTSSIFPYSYVLTGTEGQSPGYDPLAIMVYEAHLRDLSVEAWINPYRIRSGSSNKPLCDTNPAVSFMNSGSDAVIKYDNIISYNPASQTARDLIVQGVVEIIENYSIDGIHFDDYFYPTTDLAFDSHYYNAYRSAGGPLSQEDWRRDNVNKLIAQVYAAVKRTDSRVLFGVSPQANMSNNYNHQYADVRQWLSNVGYIDYICPQVYFGFQNETLPFSQTVRDWSALITNGQTKLYIGIGAYKIGTEDKYAGTGSREWITGKDILSRMVSDSRTCSNYKGFAMYRYDFLFSPASGTRSQMSGEMQALRDILKN